MPARLSHTDARGRVRMIDVGAKPETAREAVASAGVRMSAATLALVLGDGGAAKRAGHPGGGGRGDAGGSPKGDVLATARVAAIAALKRTSDLIPLCHPVRLVGSAVDIARDDGLPGLRVRVTARAFDRTGVEMEALVGATAAALTIYDMVKGVERGVEIVSVRLEEKRGGRSGEWLRGSQLDANASKQPPGRRKASAPGDTAMVAGAVSVRHGRRALARSNSKVAGPQRQ